jgi:hypothetical protein
VDGSVVGRARIKEGMPLCLEVMEIEGWGKRNRITSCLKTLGHYGGAAKPRIPTLKQLEQKLKNHREACGLQPQIKFAPTNDRQN